MPDLARSGWIWSTAWGRGWSRATSPLPSLPQVVRRLLGASDILIIPDGGSALGGRLHVVSSHIWGLPR
jgi:hypothetical protein